MRHLRLVHSVASAPAPGADALQLIPALINAAKVVPRQPDVVRARAIVRARIALATTMGAGLAPASQRRGRRLRVTAAACAAFVAVAAGTAAALHGRGSNAPADAWRAVAATPMSVKRAETARERPAPLVSAGRVVASRRARPPRTDAPSYRSPAAEVECLQRAQVAFAGRDFLGALAASAEHARRFPTGWLAEERDALRVRSLAGTGRADEARRAAVAFGERFPRSALLSRRGSLLPNDF